MEQLLRRLHWKLNHWLIGDKIGKKMMLLISFITVLIGTTIQIIATTNERQGVLDDISSHSP
jgi:hypothetical protein